MQREPRGVGAAHPSPSAELPDNREMNRLSLAVFGQLPPCRSGRCCPITSVWTIHLSGPDENRPLDAVVMAAWRTKILRLVRLTEYPLRQLSGNISGSLPAGPPPQHHRRRLNGEPGMHYHQHDLALVHDRGLRPARSVTVAPGTRPPHAVWRLWSCRPHLLTRGAGVPARSTLRTRHLRVRPVPGSGLAATWTGRRPRSC